jgi:hypothetical protein
MSIALSLGNNLTTGGVFTSSAVNNTSVTNVTDFASVAGSSTYTLLSTQTASGDASISFTSGINSTYLEYVFHFSGVHPQTDTVDFQFQASTDGGSNYNTTVTNTNFRAYNASDSGTNGVSVIDGEAQGNGTSYINLIENEQSNDADESLSGYLQLFSPSTSFVKHFLARSEHTKSVYMIDNFIGGYFNTTSAINAVNFKFSSGNIDTGVFRLYGVKYS